MAGRPVVAFFVGNFNPTTGKSWCPDCREADPVVKKVLAQTCPDLLMLSIEVGDKRAWRDDWNPFRTDPLFKLTNIPTLIRFALQ
ncbi:hypothetical protein Ciccas_001551, partial [Cichlidogyrus casuarinus]